VLNFALVPAGKTLRITHINCFVNVEQEQDWTIIHLAQGPARAPQAKNAFGVHALNPEAAIGAYLLNAETSTFIQGGTRPLVLLTAGLGLPAPALGGQCTLAGVLVGP
jgi:hypothetical protein